MVCFQLKAGTQFSVSSVTSYPQIPVASTSDTSRVTKELDNRGEAPTQEGVNRGFSWSTGPA